MATSEEKRNESNFIYWYHGSRLAAGNDEVRTFIQQLTPSIDDSYIVETCFLEFEAPNIPAGIDACVKRGATEVYAVPIILLQAGHSKIHIPAAIDAARLKYPDVTFTYGRPLGVHEEVLNILTERLSGTGLNIKEKQEDTAILFIGTAVEVMRMQTVIFIKLVVCFGNS